jgi:hypothetical protein
MIDAEILLKVLEDRKSKSISLAEIAKALPIDREADARATEAMDEIYRKETHRKI